LEGVDTEKGNSAKISLGWGTSSRRESLVLRKGVEETRREKKGKSLGEFKLTLEVLRLGTGEREKGKECVSK